MALNASPGIACVGVIGRFDNLLHISLFPPREDQNLEMSFLLNTSLDIFDLRQSTKTFDQDLGLLQAVDERLSVFGYLTNTGVKFIVVVDMAGKPPGSEDERRKTPPIISLRDSDLKPAWKAIHAAYCNLLLNPFYTPDDRTPLQQVNHGSKPTEITSKRFIDEIQRIGRAWGPGASI